MRFSDLDIQTATKEKRQNWEDTLDELQQTDLKDLHQFIKDNGIQLTDLDKQMISGANDLNGEEIARQLTAKMKGVYSGFGKNYEVERQLKQHRNNQRLARAAD